ncbi:MAG: (2Fe-2S)-binding protein [Granulosicoccaceae bacterium]
MHRIKRYEMQKIAVFFEGQQLTAETGDSVAAALLLANNRMFRTTPVSGSARGPLCMMGICFDCLVEIDGVGNQQACMVEVRQGMKIKRQDGALDLLPVQDSDKKHSDSA